MLWDHSFNFLCCFSSSQFSGSMSKFINSYFLFKSVLLQIQIWIVNMYVVRIAIRNKSSIRIHLNVFDMLKSQQLRFLQLHWEIMNAFQELRTFLQNFHSWSNWVLIYITSILLLIISLYFIKVLHWVFCTMKNTIFTSKVYTLISQKILLFCLTTTFRNFA